MDMVKENKDDLSRVNRNKKNNKETRRERKVRIKNERKEMHPAKRILYGTGRFVRRTIMVLLLIASFIVLSGSLLYKYKLEEVFSSSIRDGYEIAQSISPEDFSVVEPSVMYDTNGEVLRTFTERNFKYLDLQEDDELYDKVSKVTTAIEDERFYKHQGFDYLGVGVAVFDYAVKGNSLRGASTITAQLVKNTYLTQEQNIERKITEAVIAQELEKIFTKREILEFYLNDAYFANGNYGLETAAHYYYSKPTSELTYSEIASLVAIPNNPTIYNPIENPDNNTKRRNLILTLLGRNGIMDESEVKEEQEKELALEITETRIDNNIKGWAESFAMHSTVEEMMRYNGFSFEYWHSDNDSRKAYKERYNDIYHQTLQRIMRGGYVINTSIDRGMQEKLQATVDNAFSGYTAIDKNGYYKKQAPSVVIDNRTNEVVAIVGGRTQDDMGLFNRAYQSARQPGSATKPFLSYAPAFEKGLATGTIRKDAPINKGPGNWYAGYRGDMTLRTALEQSVNTIAYNLYQEVGMDFARQKLIDMEFNHLAPEDVYPTMAVGGWTYGTNPLEVASAFNTLVNDGMYYRPNNVRSISLVGSDDFFYNREEHVPKRVYQSGVGYVTLDVLQSTVRDSFVKSYSIGYDYEAAKTGTTNEVRELWIVGGTPHYSMASYIGDNDPAPQNSNASSNVLRRIYTSYMKDIHKGLEVKDFEKPQTVAERGNNLWVRTKKDEDPQKQRLANEASRVQSHINRQAERVDSLSYRIKHGLSLKQAVAREKSAEALIQKIEAYDLDGSKDLSQASEFRRDAENAIEKVVRSEEKRNLSIRLDKAYSRVVANRDAIIAREESLKRAEEERVREEKRREEEKIRLEEELIEREKEEERRRIEKEKMEEERRIKEEEERKREQERREKEEKERLEQEQSNSDIEFDIEEPEDNEEDSEGN